MRSEYWGKLSWKFPPIKKRCLSHHSFSLSHISVKKSAVLFFFFLPQSRQIFRGVELFCVRKWVSRAGRKSYYLISAQSGVTSHDITATILKPCVYAFKEQEHRTKILPVSFGKPTKILCGFSVVVSFYESSCLLIIQGRQDSMLSPRFNHKETDWSSTEHSRSESFTLELRARNWLSINLLDVLNAER